MARTVVVMGVLCAAAIRFNPKCGVPNAVVLLARAKVCDKTASRQEIGSVRTLSLSQVRRRVSVEVLIMLAWNNI